ncbi:restriction endonuclease subunit S [Avibacterium paragallinarum]|uniref:restriction endonuclease subunit S n=1 Tax=Avibacterium paragallinarum TaxID=728 RepID=UPI0021F7CC42|nr:restriction endonuclease subunit S [Avibacterium paragallinarum]UXN35460.1 restriction endonuclease subunit S [Avibacterium paragallinarum]
MKKVSFETLFEIPLRNGVTKPKKIRGKGYKMVNMGELFSYPIINNISMDRAPLTELEEKNSLLENYDLLFARQSLVRSGAGQCSIFISDDEKVCFESHIIRCRLDKNKANPLFYFYLFRSNIGRNIMDTIIEQGAGASGIRGSDLSKLMIPYIDIKIQNDIAEKLFSLDQKIELNTQTNQTLEQIAQGIFKHWFIDFAPVHAKANALARGETTEQAELAAMACLSGKTVEKITALKTQDPTAYHQLQQTAAAFPSEFVETEMGEVPKGWAGFTIKDCCKNLYNGGTPRRKIDSYWNKGTIPWLSSGEVCNNNILIKSKEFITEEGLAKSAAKIVPVNSTLVAIYASPTAGKCSLCAFETTTNQAVCSLVPIENFQYFNYLNLKTKELYFANQAVGSAQQNISKQIIEETSSLKPNNEVINSFNLLVEPIFKKWISNLNENLSLSNTRDTLLPKLLNGEVKL